MKPCGLMTRWIYEKLFSVYPTQTQTCTQKDYIIVNPHHVSLVSWMTTVCNDQLFLNEAVLWSSFFISSNFLSYCKYSFSNIKCYSIILGCGLYPTNQCNCLPPPSQSLSPFPLVLTTKYFLWTDVTEEEFLYSTTKKMKELPSR